MFLLDLDTITLTSEERELLVHPKVCGVILFTRNYESPKQLKELTQAIKKKSPNAIIAADQEGGRVQRFRDSFTTLPPMQHWGLMYQQDAEKAKKTFAQMLQTMIQELHEVGINMNLVPVLDLDLGKNQVIGERSFHSDPQIVTVLAQTLITVMHSHQMPVVGKHFPGHGGVNLDSHHELPVDDRDFESLQALDLKPFADLASELNAIMPAHIVYSQIDKNPVAFSRVWLQDILRDSLDFKGIIMSDDLSMAGAAGMGSYSDRAQGALEAGCDLLLACNNRNGAVEVIETLERYRKFAPSEQRINYLKKSMKI